MSFFSQLTVTPQSRKLLYLSLLQFFLFVLVFFVFFFSLGVHPLISLVGALSFYALIFLIFQMLTLPFFILPQIKGAVYVPSADDKIETMIELLDLKKNQKMADLGSGDGRVTIAFAKKGIEAHGYELNPILVKRSEQNISNEKLENKAFAHWQSLWDVDLSQFDAITLYGIPYIMKGLEEKMQKELKKGAKVASNAFTFPNWKPKKIKNNVMLYVKEK